MLTMQDESQKRRIKDSEVGQNLAETFHWKMSDGGTKSGSRDEENGVVEGQKKKAVVRID